MSELEDFLNNFTSEGTSVTENTPVENNKPLGNAMIVVSLDGEVHKITPDRPSYPVAKDYEEAEREKERLDKVGREKKAEKEHIEAQIEELKRDFGARLSELQEQLKPIDDVLHVMRREYREAGYRVQSAEQKLRDALLAEKQREAYKESSLHFDEITLNMPWREHAFEHQIEGAKMLSVAKRAILGDEMGLGKTLTSMITCDMLQVQKILVIVPDDVVSNFLREIHHWAPHRQPVMVGKMNKTQRDMIVGVLRNLDAFTVVVNYSAWRKDKSLLDKLVSLRFDTVIMDEAHSIKNVTTSAFKGCEKLVLSENSCPKCSGAIQQVHYSGDYIYDPKGIRLPRDYPVCIGKSVPTSHMVDIDVAPMKEGCGWSLVVDRLAGIKREYGANRSVKYVFPMTGTPILNKPQDLFAQLRLIDDEHFDSEAAYLRTYCQKNYYTDKWEFQYGGLESLTKRLAGRYIARKKKDAGIVLPKQDVVVHNIELDPTLYPDQFRIIQQLSKQAMLILESGKRLPIFATIALITRKRQANVWAAGIQVRDPETDMVVFSVGDEVRESIKLDRIITEPSRAESGEWEGLVPDYTGGGDKINGDRVVVFSQFKGPLIELEKRMKAAGIDVVRFDGDTPEDIRNQVKIDFDRKVADQDGYEYKWQVALCNYKSGGVGLNFNAATHAIILDEEWNAGKRDQAYARLDRMGQTEENTVDVLRIDKTIDTWLANLIDSKEALAEGFQDQAAMANSLLDAMRNGEVM